MGLAGNALAELAENRHLFFHCRCQTIPNRQGLPKFLFGPFPFLILHDLIRWRHDFENVKGNTVAPGENLDIEDIDVVQGEHPRNFRNKARAVFGADGYRSGVGVGRALESNAAKSEWFGLGLGLGLGLGIG